MRAEVLDFELQLLLRPAVGPLLGTISDRNGPSLADSLLVP